jgi:hypothetical protein
MMSSGSGVFSIQKPVARGGCIGKAMPVPGAMRSRNIMPQACSSAVAATSTL